ncbi:hypothetical protein [Enterovirga sp. CN4-39]|uniref:hypothetical protein n=1 Tax=Enterovirga sp. CN4-39 TaxID=3400910 RepID=UPI003BFC2331
MPDKAIRGSVAAALAQDGPHHLAQVLHSPAAQLLSGAGTQSAWWKRRPPAKPHRSGNLDSRAAAALAEERQRSGRTGAHALTLAYVAVAVWCALVHPWPGAIFYLALVAGFIGLAAGWAWLARRPTPSWLVLGFVLANAILLTITLLLPNPFDHPPWPIQMKLRPPAFPFFILLIAWATFTLSPALVIGATIIIAATWSCGVALLAWQPGALLGFGMPGSSPKDLAHYLDARFIDTAG